MRLSFMIGLLAVMLLALGLIKEAAANEMQIMCQDKIYKNYAELAKDYEAKVTKFPDSPEKVAEACKCMLNKIELQVQETNSKSELDCMLSSRLFEVISF
jgi:hypothetical protein